MHYLPGASTPNSHVTSCASLKHVTDVTTTDSNAVSHRTDKNDGVHSNQRDISPDVDGYYKHDHVTPATPTREQLDPSECYCMSLRNKGIVFVLNNNDYVDRGVRKGSEIDVINVTHVFNEIGYTPVVKQNLTAQEIRGALAEVKRTIRKIHTSVVLVFMSHGVQEGIYGSDGVVISVEDIKEMFSGKNCPALIGKPKIFFFQACRGSKNYLPP
ncbi:caspase-2-like [Diadema antillarum]|uniref:caspase-2-like n=1 Tax=Diadema antillarum TaxID=105358 RepID=UPI003A8BEBFA